MKILFLTNIPSPYRVDFFNELGKISDLTVVFEKVSSTVRDASWKRFDASSFKPVFMKGLKRGVGNTFCPGVIRYLRKKTYDEIVVSNFTSPTGMLAILWLRLRKIPYWLESDGGFAKSGKGFKEKLKQYFIKGAKGYFSTAQEHDRYYMCYGAEKEKICRYPFTSLKNEDILEKPVSEEKKTELREKLGIKEDRVIIAVGQFIYRKGYDVLLAALRDLPRDIGCYIVGGKPTQQYIDIVTENELQNVHFVGFIQKQQLREYYQASDVFVHPTREDIWGLVVNEAMANGLPVVTTDRCIAGCELIQKPELGKIISADDSDGLANAIECMFDEIDQNTSLCVLQAVRPYSIEQMAERHIEVFQNYGA